MSEDLVDVVLLEVPVSLWSRAQEQSDALLREFALMAAGGVSVHELPHRLTELVTALDARYSGQTTSQEEELFAAAEAGVPVLPALRYRVPAEAGQASRALSALLEEADGFCAQGQHLLTLAADDQVVMLREWWLTQFAEQATGAPAVSWPQWVAAHA